MFRALERGLTLQDWEILTPGMIIGYIVTHNNERLDDDDKGGTIRAADQADFDKF